jgi:hypothetical protein
VKSPLIEPDHPTGLIHAPENFGYLGFNVARFFINRGRVRSPFRNQISEVVENSRYRISVTDLETRAGRLDTFLSRLVNRPSGLTGLRVAARHRFADSIANIAI